MDCRRCFMISLTLLQTILCLLVIACMMLTQTSLLQHGEFNVRQSFLVSLFKGMAVGDVRNHFVGALIALLVAFITSHLCNTQLSILIITDERRKVFVRLCCIFVLTSLVMFGGNMHTLCTMTGSDVYNRTITIEGCGEALKEFPGMAGALAVALGGLIPAICGILVATCMKDRDSKKAKIGPKVAISESRPSTKAENSTVKSINEHE